jgi:hypothetical protein
MQITVKHLQVGDILSSSAVVMERPFDSVSTPSGKTNLSIRYPGAAPKLVIWGKSTNVNITNR